MSASNSLKLSNINKTFNAGTVNESTLFTNFNLSVLPKEFISVVGSNGSGKTTMLNIISGTTPIDSGKIMLSQQDITKLTEYKRAKRIGRVYQNPQIGTVPSMSVLENLSMAMNKGRMASLAMAVDKRKIEYFKETVSELKIGLEDKLDIQVGLLSGGQRQALSLIMSTMTPIDLLLLDEHTAALDPKTAETIMALTDRIVKEKELTAIMVTHNLRYAVDYGTRLIMMHKGNIIIDKSEDEKKTLQVSDLLKTFNEISIECGN